MGIGEGGGNSTPPSPHPPDPHSCWRFIFSNNTVSRDGHSSTVTMLPPLVTHRIIKLIILYFGVPGWFWRVPGATSVSIHLQKVLPPIPPPPRNALQRRNVRPRNILYPPGAAYLWFWDTITTVQNRIQSNGRLGLNFVPRKSVNIVSASYRIAKKSAVHSL